MQVLKNIVILLLILLFAVSLFFNVHCYLNYRANKTVLDTTRTIYIDTLHFLQPTPKDSIIVRYVVAKLPTNKKEMSKDSCLHTQSNNDSVTVNIPIKQKIYQDSNYNAYISGYRVQLDSILLYPQKEVTTITKINKSRWGIGLQVGIGSTIQQPKLTPYIGIGITYNLFTTK